MSPKAGGIGRRFQAASRRWSPFQIALLSLLVGCAIGVAAASLLSTSPGAAAEKRAIPDLPLPSTKIVRQVLREEVRAPCQPQSQQTQIMPPRVSVGSPRVVTSIARRGRLRTGELLGTVSGVPILAFLTTIPFYRDLSLGDRGPDVAALERSLVDAGVLSSSTDVFNAQTASALDKLYGHLLADRPELQGRLLLASTASVPPGSVIEQVDAGVGQVVTARTPLLVLSRNAGRLSCSVPGSVALSVGEHLRAASTGSGTVSARVVSVDSANSENGERHAVVQTTQAAALAAADLIIPIQATPAPVLTVPAGAIWLSPHGGFEVREIVRGGVRPVRVQLGATAAGYVAITGRGLSSGDPVELNSASGSAVTGESPTLGTQ